MQYGQAERIVRDVMRAFSKSHEEFNDAPEDDQEFLRMFGFICTLSFDVYIKKLLIERTIDNYFKKEEDVKSSKDENKNSSKDEEKKSSKDEKK